MNLHKLNHYLLLTTATFAGAVALATTTTTTQASARTFATPIRGTWYHKTGKHQTAVKFTASAAKVSGMSKTVKLSNKEVRNINTKFKLSINGTKTKNYQVAGFDYLGGTFQFVPTKLKLAGKTRKVLVKLQTMHRRSGKCIRLISHRLRGRRGCGWRINS
jgi:hypothetical protein